MSKKKPKRPFYKNKKFREKVLIPIIITIALFSAAFLYNHFRYPYLNKEQLTSVTAICTGVEHKDLTAGGGGKKLYCILVLDNNQRFYFNYDHSTLAKADYDKYEGAVCTIEYSEKAHTIFNAKELATLSTEESCYITLYDSNKYKQSWHNRFLVSAAILSLLYWIIAYLDELMDRFVWKI